MSALFCLTAAKIKNKLLETAKNPLKLIVLIAFAVLLVMNFSLSGTSSSQGRPIAEFKAIIFAFYILCFVTEANKGFYSGGTMFSMADVNLLFMSPVKASAVLFYGMLSRFGSSVFMALAFVYQFVLIKNVYYLTLADILTATGGYAAVLFLSQLTAMLIYCYTCGDSNKIKKAKAVFYVALSLFAAVFVITLLSSPFVTVTTAASALTSLPMKLFFVAGWVFSAVDVIMSDSVASFIPGLAASLIFAILGFVLIAFSKNGFYEDVLLSCEKNADRKADDGINVNIRTRKTGSLKRGRGASVLFYKHCLENHRTKTAVLSSSSLINLVLIGVYGFLSGGEFAILFAFSCMVSFVPVLSGRWLRELTMPHVYLIPEPYTKKLFYILPEMLPKLLAESVLQCALISYICHLGIVTAVAIIIVRLSVSFVLVGSALVAARIFREKEKNNIFLTVSVLPGFILVLPSVAAFMVALNFSFVLAFAAMAAVNFAVATFLILCSRNILKISA